MGSKHLLLGFAENLGGRGVEPTPGGMRCRPPGLKITRSVLIGYENSLLYLTLPDSLADDQKWILMRTGRI
jgi:hypothetical protein